MQASIDCLRGPGQDNNREPAPSFLLQCWIPYPQTHAKCAARSFTRPEMLKLRQHREVRGGQLGGGNCLIGRNPRVVHDDQEMHSSCGVNLPPTCQAAGDCQYRYSQAATQSTGPAACLVGQICPDQQPLLLVAGQEGGAAIQQLIVLARVHDVWVRQRQLLHKPQRGTGLLLY